MVSMGLGLLASGSVLSWSWQAFLPNFLFFWMTQLIVVGSMVPFSKRPAAPCGVALALAIYVCLFVLWLAKQPFSDWNGFQFVIYALALPGGWIGAGISVAVTRVFDRLPASIVVWITGGSTCLGLACNALLIA